MALFRRKRKAEAEAEWTPPPAGQDAPPEWASFMTGQGYLEFLGLVDETLEGMGLPHRWGDGFVEVDLEGFEAPHTLGLSNLAQNVHDLDHDERRLAIAEHFAKMVRLSERAGADPAPFEHAAPMLKLRLWGKADIPPAMHRPGFDVADDLVAVLAIDLPDSVASVGDTDLEAWGQPVDALLDRARTNTIEDPATAIEGYEHEDGTAASFTVSDEFFGASRALWPDTVLDDVGEHGALVAFPNRHIAWLVPIEDAEIIGVINQVAPWVQQTYAEGPGSISPHLYWWRDGTFTRQALAVEDGTITFTPSDDFVALLDELAR